MLESLSGDGESALSVVSVNGKPKEWTSPHRIGAAGLRVHRVLAAALETGSRAEEIQDCTAGERRVVALPVFGPGGVYGVQLWIGELGVRVPPSRPVAAFEWSLDELLVRYTLTTHGGQGPRRGPVVVNTAPEFTERLARFDQGAAVISLGADPQPGQRFAGQVSSVSEQGLRCRRVVLRASTSGFRGLSEDVQIPDGAALPAVEATVTARAARHAGFAAAMLAFSCATPGRVALAAWINGPPGWTAYRWGHTHATPDLLHPGDRGALLRARRDIAGGAAVVQRIIRLPSHNGKWIHVNADLRPVNGHPHLCIAEFPAALPSGPRQLKQRHPPGPGTLT